MTKREAVPFILPVFLLLLAVIIFFFGNWLQLSLKTVVVLLSVVDIGFIVSAILGILTKKTNTIIYSILANLFLFFSWGIITYLLALAAGISEP